MQNSEKLQNQNNPFMEEENSSFDFRFWAIKIARYWYLFVVSIAICMGIAYFQNRKWQPIYKTSARMMIEEGKSQTIYSTGSQNIMQGFGIQASYRNVNNQIIIFGSYDLIGKVVDQLPLAIDCYSQGRFKQNNLYKRTPVNIVQTTVTPEAYGIEYTISEKGNDGYIISWENDDEQYSVNGTYNSLLNHKLFSIIVSKSPEFYSSKYSFKFRFKSHGQLVAEYDSRLDINFVMEGSSVVAVSLTGKVADRDVDFLNSLCQAFIDQNLARKNEAAIKTIDFINSQLSEISDSIAVSEGNWQAYRRQNQIVDIKSYTGQILTDLTGLEALNSAFKLKEAYFSYLTKYLSKKDIQDEIIVVPSTLGISDPTLIRLVSDYNDNLNKRRDVGTASPFYTKYTSNLEIIRGSLQEVLKGLKASLDIERNDLRMKNAENDRRIAQLPSQESLLSKYERKYKINDNYYTFLLQKKAESQILKASNSPDNVLLETARVIAVTNGGETKKTNTLFLVIGLLLPLAFIILKDFLNDKILDKKDIDKLSPYPYLGSIQHTTHTSPSFVLRNPRSAFAESYRIIRTRLEFIVKRQYPIMTLVTSTESGDGKTSFSINMASMYVLTGHKTILIDLDLRKPSVLNRLKINGDKNRGISNYLANQFEDLNELIITNTKYKFDVIGGGSIPPNPGELVRSDKLKELIDKLKTMYDYIIIDTSPIGLVADNYALMHWTDVNLFVLRSEKTKKLFFKNIINQLKADQAPNIQIVLNDIDEKKTTYSTTVEYGRKAYYIKKNDYHSYVSKYFDQEDEPVVAEPKTFKEKVFSFIKDLFNR